MSQKTIIIRVVRRKTGEDEEDKDKGRRGRRKGREEIYTERRQTREIWRKKEHEVKRDTK